MHTHIYFLKKIKIKIVVLLGLIIVSVFALKRVKEPVKLETGVMENSFTILSVRAWWLSG